MPGMTDTEFLLAAQEVYPQAKRLLLTAYADTEAAIQAINEVDIPVMASYLMMIGFFFVVINLIVDLLYLAIDPRIRDGQLRQQTL